MKTKGFTLIESVVAVAIIAIVFLLSTPLIKSMGMVNERMEKQNQIDSEFSVVSKFIKDSVRSSKNNEDLSVYSNNPDFAGVFSQYKNKPKKLFKNKNNGTKKFFVSDDETGPLLFLEIPVLEEDGSEPDSKFVFFYFDDSKKELQYRESAPFDAAAEADPDNYEFGGSWTTLMENVENAGFQFRKDIVIFSIDIDVDEFEGEIKDKLRDSVTSRIDF